MMLAVRTTVTLDPDTHELVRKLMTERGLTFKQAVNDAIRAGLAPAEEPKRFKQRTYRLGPAADERMIIKSLQYAGELEDEEILRKLRLGK
jgi:hypothetical protein